MGVDVDAITIIGFKIPKDVWLSKISRKKCWCGVNINIERKDNYCDNCGKKLSSLIPEGVPLHQDKINIKFKNIMFDPGRLCDSGTGSDTVEANEYIVCINNHIWLFFDGEGKEFGNSRIDENYVFICIDIMRRGVYRCVGEPIRSSFDFLELNKLQTVLEKDLLSVGIQHYDFGIWITGEFGF